MARKQKETRPAPTPAPRQRLCETCKHCDVRNFGFCENSETRQQLEGFTGLIFDVKKFGCIYHKERGDG